MAWRLAPFGGTWGLLVSLMVSARAGAKHTGNSTVRFATNQNTPLTVLTNQNTPFSGLTNQTIESRTRQEMKFWSLPA